MSQLKLAFLFALSACGSVAHSKAYSFEDPQIFIGQKIDQIPKAMIRSSDCKFLETFQDCVVTLNDERSLAIFSDLIIGIYYNYNDKTMRADFSVYKKIFEQQNYNCDIPTKSCINVTLGKEFRYLYNYNDLSVVGLFKIDEI